MPKTAEPSVAGCGSAAPAIAAAFKLWALPPHLDLAEWMEESIILPTGASATPGRVRLWPHQRGIADAISHPEIEKVVVQKAARVGYSLLLGGYIGSCIANDPAAVLCIVPTDGDAKNFVTDQLESVFDASPELRGRLNTSKRNRMLYRKFAGGWLRVVAAKSPRNLRAHTAKVVVFDEIDAFEVSSGKEGNPVALGIKRSDTFRDRKIILGGTPVDKDTSHVIREYEASDQRVFEIPCPRCGESFELLWRHIRWEDDDPETAHAECPQCGGWIEESEKAEIVARGAWRITRPDVKGVAGFRLNALISTIPAATWPKIVAEFLKAKRSPDTLKPFINTVLGEGWESREGDGLDENDLAARAEPFGLTELPEGVRAIVCGVDVQAWGLCVLTLGFGADKIYVLDYRDLHGDPHGDEVWKDLEKWLRSRFPHKLGGQLGIDACAVDSGDGNLTQVVYDFTRPRFGRRVISTKGHDGNRPLIEKSSKPGLYLLGVDTGKQRVHNLIAAKGKVRFSADLPERFYEELGAEYVRTIYKNGFPKKIWEKVKGMRNEALDCFVMALGVRSLFQLDETQRENALRGVAAPQPTVTRSKFLGEARV
ncbi:MAG: terminase gpA endonuclease subunit [Pseudomonadota bacterium]